MKILGLMLMLFSASFGAAADDSAAPGAVANCPLLPQAAVRLAIDPSLDPALSSLATQLVIHAEYDEWAQASNILERALRLWPKNPQLWCLLARVRWQQGKPSQAQAMALRARIFDGLHRAAPPALPPAPGIVPGIVNDFDEQRYPKDPLDTLDALETVEVHEWAAPRFDSAELYDEPESARAEAGLADSGGGIDRGPRRGRYQEQDFHLRDGRPYWRDFGPEAYPYPDAFPEFRGRSRGARLMAGTSKF